MRKLIAGVLLGSAAAFAVLAMAAGGLLDTVELELYDWRIRQAADPATVHPDIVLIDINDQTLRDMAPDFGRWPWPRVAHTLILDFLSRAPARVVAVDVGFWEEDLRSSEINGQIWTGPDSDAALAASVRAAGNVILLGDAVYAGVEADQANRPADWQDPGYRLGPAIEARPMLLAPFQALSDASVGIGHNFLPLDPDGTARRMPPFVRIGDRHVPSLGMAAALAGGGFSPADVSLLPGAIRAGDRTIPLVTTRVPDPLADGGSRDQLSMLINYRAGATTSEGVAPYPRYEARFVMMSEHQLQMGETPDLDPAAFRDKIVFIGTSASGAHDVFQTPFLGAAMPGIQVHASMADSLLSNRFLGQAAGWMRPASVVAAGLVVALMTVLLGFRTAVLGAAILAGLWTWLALAMFGQGVWVNLSQPAAAMGLSLFGGTAYRYFVEDREKRKVQRLFGRYVSKDVYDQLLAHPERAELGGARREMSVLFSDIRGFTSVAEHGNPEALVAQLNEYFSRMVEIVFHHQGTVDKFVGDMVMALFGAPLDDDRHADHAVATAIEMVEALGQLNRKWAGEGRLSLDIGIGVNSGEMIAGNIGSSSIMSYTVIGDNVNLGARLESLNKEHGTRIIISEATRGRLTGPCDVRPLGDVVVKGKSRPVSIFEVQVPSPLPAPPAGAA